MTLNIGIITEDSNAKLPPINKWKSKIGRGKNIENIPEIKSLLKKNHLKIPDNDIENEELYTEILKDYIRQAKFMFSGNFSEIRNFSNFLEKYGKVNFYILSGRYGMIKDNKIIIPYNYHLNSESKLLELDNKTNFSNIINEVCKKSDILFISLPTYIMGYVINKNVLITENNSLKIAVCGNFYLDIMKENGFLTYPRLGVVRLGKDNRFKIIDLIDNYYKSKQ